MTLRSNTKQGQDVSDDRKITKVAVTRFFPPKLVILATQGHDPTAYKARAGTASAEWVFNRLKCCIELCDV
jgi:hypothetical protein